MLLLKQGERFFLAAHPHCHALRIGGSNKSLPAIFKMF